MMVPVRRRILRYRRPGQLRWLGRHNRMADAGDVQQIRPIRSRDWFGCLRGAGVRRLRHIVVDSLVVIVDGDGEHLLGQILTDDVRVEVLHDLLWWRRLFARVLRLLLDRLLRVHFAEHDEEVMAFLALYEARGADEGFDVRAGITAFRAG